MSPSKNTENYIAIIGGGVAGIAAAAELLKEGIDFDLYEASPEIGGRASVIYDKTSDEYIDNGQHLLSGAYEHFLSLITYLGTDDKIFRPNSLIVPYFAFNKTPGITKESLLDTSRGIGKLGTLLGLLKFDLLSIKDKYTIAILATQISLGITKTKSDETCNVFLKRHKQTNNSITVFWEPLILAVLNTPVNQASAFLLERVCKLAFFADKEKAALLFPTTELKELVSPIEKKIEDSNSNLYLKTKISGIELFEDKISLKISNNYKTYKKVISALPYHVLSRLSDKISFDNYNTSSITSIYLWTNKELIAEEFKACIGTTVQWIFNRTKINGIVHSISRYCYSITISASSELLKMKSEELIDIVISDLNNLTGSFAKDDIVHFRIINEKMATFVASPIFETERKSVPSSINDKLYIAGDWTNTNLPGTLESAAVSGKIAAQSLVNSL